MFDHVPEQREQWLRVSSAMSPCLSSRPHPVVSGLPVESVGPQTFRTRPRVFLDLSRLESSLIHHGIALPIRDPWSYHASGSCVPLAVSIATTTSFHAGNHLVGWQGDRGVIRCMALQSYQTRQGGEGQSCGLYSW